MTNMPSGLLNLAVVEQKELLIGLLSQSQERVYPLSLAQQRLWFLDQLHPGNPAYNVPFGIHLQGELNLDALERSIRDLTQRHEILRTRFFVINGRPVQVVVATNLAIEVSFIDLTKLPIADRRSKLHSVGMESARHPFNLSTGPLLRFHIIRSTTEEHILLGVMHHIICDAWSLEILLRELATLYRNHCDGPPASLIDLPIQYGHYAEWQHQSTADEIFAAQAQCWNRKLAGAPSLLNLPADRSRPYEQSYDGASHLIPIPKALIDEIVDYGSKQRVTSFIVMLAVFKTLLHYYTAAKDILVGVPVANRNRIELEDLIGFFVNTLVLRTSFYDDPHFSDLLFRVRETTLEAFANADIPFEKVVEALNPSRTLSCNPVFQVMFSTVKTAKLPDFGTVQAGPYFVDNCTSLVDLSVEVIEDAGDQWWLRVRYATALFDHVRMTKLLDDYLALLMAVVRQPDLRIGDFASILELDKGTTHNGYSLAGQTTNPVAAIRPTQLLEDVVEPADALEPIMIRIWERVLSTTGIRAHDDFFDLGGHSLLAAQLISEIEKVVGRRVPLSALFHGSTVASLADVIRNGTEFESDPLVTELNPGTQGLPLFAIVQPGWDAIGYASMARQMKSGQPFYKLQDNASDSNLLTIEELGNIAQRYLAAMRAIQPKGPYFLVSMCHGVHIAEQMVLELESEGHEVGALGIIDTFVLQNSLIRWLAYIDSFRQGRQSIARLPLLAQLAHYKRVVRRRLSQLFGREPRQPNPVTEILWPKKTYSPRQFHAPVLLFRTPRQAYFHIRDPEMGWGARTLSGVKICTVENVAHSEMLREPSATVIAKQLTAAMQAYLPITTVEPNYHAR